MLIDDWATRETNFYNARKNGNNLEEKNLGGLKVYKMINWHTNYYYSTETTKTQIVLHYTVGPVDASLPWLSRQDYHVSVAYMIARDGTVYELFDPKYWAYSLGISGSHNDHCNKQGIAIEICNIGWLEKFGDIIKYKIKVNNVYVWRDYCRAADTKYYYKHYELFRGYYYYGTYTNEQYNALRKLIPYLCTKYKIEFKFLPEKTRNDTLTVNEMKNFKGILTHTNFRPGTEKQDVGPAFRWSEIMGFSLPVRINPSMVIENGGGIKPTHAALERYYYHTEIENRGGYFPVGANTVWHGGVHIRTGSAGEPVLAMACGKIVAARLGEEDNASKHYGSRNFMLLEHMLGDEKYYSLYMHLHWEQLTQTNEHLKKINWLQKQKTVNNQAVLEVDKDILDKLKKGTVCKFDDKSVATGEQIWTSGLCGSPDYRTALIHWEIFSEKRIMKDMWLKSLMDSDNDSIVDLATLINLIDVKDLTTKRGDGMLSAEEIVQFYRYNSRDAKALRYYACKFILENAINWDSAVNELQNRGFLNYKNIGLADRLKEYNFWDDAKSAGVALPASPQVWHYNPMSFIEMALLRTKRLRFQVRCFDANRSFPKQGVCSLISSLFAIERENPDVKFLCLGYAGSSDNSCGNKPEFSKKRAEVLSFLALNNDYGKHAWIARFDYNTNWGNREVQTILTFLTRKDGSGPYYYNYKDNAVRSIDNTNGTGQKEAVKAFEEDNGFEVEGEGTGQPRPAALSLMYNRYYAAFESPASTSFEPANLLGTGDTHNAEIPANTFVDILAFPEIILPLVENYQTDKINIFKQWQALVGVDVDPAAFNLRITNLLCTDHLSSPFPFMQVEIQLNHKIETPRIIEAAKTTDKPRRFFFDLEDTLLAVPAGTANPVPVNKGELTRIRYSQNGSRVRIVLDVSDNAFCKPQLTTTGGIDKLLIDVSKNPKAKLKSVTCRETNDAEEIKNKIKLEFDNEVTESKIQYQMEGDAAAGYKYITRLADVELSDDAEIKNWDKNGNLYSKNITGMSYITKIICSTGDDDVVRTMEFHLTELLEATHFETGNDDAFQINIKICKTRPVKLVNIIDGDHSNETPAYWRVVCIYSEALDINLVNITEEGKGTDNHIFSFLLDNCELEADSPLISWPGQQDELNNKFIKSIKYEKDDDAKTLKISIKTDKDASCKKGSTKADGKSERIFFDISAKQATAVMSIDTNDYQDSIPVIPTESRVQNGSVLRRIDVRVTIKQGDQPLSNVSITITASRGGFTITQPQATNTSGITSFRVETRESGEASFTITCEDYNIESTAFNIDFTEAWYESGFYVTAYHFCHESDFTGQLVDASGLNEQHRQDFLFGGRGVCMQGTGLTENNGYIRISNPGDLTWIGQYEEINNQEDAIFTYGAGGAYNPVEEGTSIAVDPAVIPPRHRVRIQRVGERRADDTGGAINNYDIDVFMGGGQQAINNWAAQGGNINNARVRYLGT